MERTYDEMYSQSLEDPERFWANVAEAVHWYKKWDDVVDFDFIDANIKWK